MAVMAAVEGLVTEQAFLQMWPADAAASSVIEIVLEGGCFCCKCQHALDVSKQTTRPGCKGAEFS